MLRRKLAVLSLVGVFITVGMIFGYIRNGGGTASMKYPAKPITIIVPYTPGGSTDIMVRAMQKTAEKYIGQQLIIMNVPGGGGNIGWGKLVGASPDGYTLGAMGSGMILQTLNGQAKYNYATALEPIVQVADFPIVFAVKADQPWENIHDLIEYAKVHPGEIKFGHSGIGLAVHIAGEMFAKEAGISLEQVPFNGDSEGIAALLGGHIQLLVGTAGIKKHIKSGSVRVLAVASEKRSTIPELENVPTLKEQGINVTLSIWQGIAAPKMLPLDVKNQLAEDFKKIVTDPEFKKFVEENGMTVDYIGPKEFGEKWVRELDGLDKFLKESGIAEKIAAQKR